MTEYILAAGDSPVRSIGALVGMLIVPLAGLVLLIVGLSNRSKSKQQRSQLEFAQHQQQFAVVPPHHMQQPPAGMPPQHGYNMPAYGQQPPQPPQPAPTKKRGTGLIIVGSLMLVLGLLTAVAQVATSSTGSSVGLDVGDCLDGSSVAAANIVDADPISCDSAEAVFVFAAMVDDANKCPDGKTAVTTDYAIVKNSTAGWCFALNLIEGQCYRVGMEGKSVDPSVCSRGSDNLIRVDKRVDGATDVQATCGGPKGVKFPVPARVYCVSAP